MAKIIPDILQVVKATVTDYNKLEPYHYCAGRIVCPTGIYKIRGRYPHSKSFPDPIAIIVYRMPFSQLRPRTQATDGFFDKPENLAGRLRLIGKNVRYLSRVIVDPRFRRLGIATNLIAETLHLQGVPLIETITPIDWTNRMFKKAGFELHPNPAPPHYRKMAEQIRTLGLTPDRELLPETLQRRIDSLSRRKKHAFNQLIKTFLRHFRRHSKVRPGLKRTQFLLAHLQYPDAYLLWRNPDMPMTSK